MKKRVASVVMVMLMVCSIVSSSTAASLPDQEIIIHDEEIKNAEIRIEDDDLITLTTVKEKVLPVGIKTYSGEKILAKDVLTTVLIVEDPNKTDEVYQQLLSVPHDAASYKSNGDVGAGLHIYSTVYYTVQEVDGYEWYRLIRVTGGNDKKNKFSNVIGSGFTIAEQQVTYGVWGNNLEGWSPILYTWRDTQKLSTKDNSFDIQVNNIHANWPTVSGSQGLLGAIYSVRIHSGRDGTNKTLEVLNYPLDNVPFSPPWG